MKKSLLAACAVAAFAMSTAVSAQAPAPIKRTPLQKVDVGSLAGARNAATLLAEASRH